VKKEERSINPLGKARESALIEEQFSQ